MRHINEIDNTFLLNQSINQLYIGIITLFRSRGSFLSPLILMVALERMIIQASHKIETLISGMVWDFTKWDVSKQNGAKTAW